jgi:cell division protein FtsI/penicillin-binding protein 2
VAATLARDFSDPDLNYILLDEKGQVLASRWPEPDKEIAIGSLIKPFLAVGYRRTHNGFPKYRCVGKKTCWLPRGHGVLGIREAIAVSCNSYFHQLIVNAGPDFAVPTLNSFGFEAEGQSEFGHASAARLANAYFELASSTKDDAVGPVLSGMAMSARSGTSRAVHSDLPDISAMAKTGTAPCSHTKKAPGDGLAVVIAPADHPRVLVLARVHGRPGAFAADVAARMIAATEAKGGGR